MSGEALNTRVYGWCLVEEVGKRPVDGKTLSEQILQSVHQFALGRPLRDDLTLIIADL